MQAGAATLQIPHHSRSGPGSWTLPCRPSNAKQLAAAAVTVSRAVIAEWGPGLGSSGSDRPGAAVRSRALRPGPPEAAERTSTAQQARKPPGATARRLRSAEQGLQRAISGCLAPTDGTRARTTGGLSKGRLQRTPAGEEVAFLAVVLETRPSGLDLYGVGRSPLERQSPPSSRVEHWAQRGYLGQRIFRPKLNKPLITL